MAKIFLDDQTAGHVYKARFTQDSDGFIWNGSAFESPTTLTTLELQAAINGVTLDAITNDDDAHIGYSLTVPAGITTACHISLYLTSYAAGDAEDYGADYDPQVGQILEDTGTTLPATLATIDDFLDTEMAAVLSAVDTEVAAIKLKTDLIPASPAAVGSAMTVSDKTGFSLAATGLDAITATEPTGKPTTFPGWVMWLIQNFRKASKTPTEKKVETEAGATVTTQAITDDGAGTETLGPPA